MQNNQFIKVLTLIVLTGLISCTSSENISFNSLLEDMLDREQLSYYPEADFSLKQFSSYDRKTVSYNEEGWYANDDRTHFLREETNQGRREFVMFDADGPGAVVRFWMTFAGAGSYDGILRFYLDNDSLPVIEGPVLDILSGGKLVEAPLSSSVSPETDYDKRGHNLYLPVPYNAHCKITYECESIEIMNNVGKPAVYYNINYRSYLDDVIVKSFSMEDLQGELLTDVQQKLKDRYRGLDEIETESLSLISELKPGEQKDLNIDQGASLRKISLKLDAKNLGQALRSTVLQISFDGEKTVWTPVGDFFGTGYIINSSSTWYTEVTEDGLLSCFWVMPFKDSCQISLINYGKQDVNIVSGEVLFSDYTWKNNSMHFGAIWHEYREIETAGAKGTGGTDEHFDINYVNLQGQGVYLGDAITIFNTVDAWWGEGDEKIWVDGEDFPSHIGTGTEDYFGYAWCRPEKFSHFLIAQPDGSGNFHPGMSVNMRYRILDGIPFHELLQFDMELWHWVRTIMNYAPVSYWYMIPGGNCLIEPIEESVKKPVPYKRTDLIRPIADENGIIEGENMVLLQKSGGTFQTQSMGNVGWSNAAQAWWMHGKKGDFIELMFLVDEAGKYKVEANLTKANDYANISLEINGKRAWPQFRGYNDEVIAEKVNLGKYELKKGENSLSVFIRGKSRKAVPNYMAGIDYIRIEKL